MPFANLGQAQKNILQFLTRPLVLFLLILVVAFISVQVLTVNSYDNAFQSRASWNMLINQRWHMDDPAEQQRTLYANPPHSAILTAPFVLFGPHVAAFFAVVCILMLFVGERRGLSALITLLLVLTPPMMFVIAEAGLIGFTTGLGLIFVLAGKRGPMRALSWALLTVRPQDNLLTLLWSGIEALRQKDWQAFVFALLLTLPTLVVLDRWLALLPSDSAELAIDPGTFYTLSIPLNSGIPAALLIIGLIVAYRVVIVRAKSPAKPLPFTLGVRRAKDFSRTEIVWLTYVIWLLLMPYYLLYVMWIMMLPVREFSATRTLALLIGSITIGYFTFQTYTMPQIYYGGLLTTVLVALLTPKTYRREAPRAMVAFDEPVADRPKPVLSALQVEE